MTLPMNEFAGLTIALPRLAFALALGSAIGFERQWNQKMAGLRTNVLVALGACGFVVFGVMAGQQDSTRIAAQIVTGIGFLGAGIILREGANVHGLNTAATLWCSAMVGTFVGGGLFVSAACAAAFIIVTNLLLRPLVQRINWRVMQATNVEAYYRIEVTSKATEEAHIRSLLLHDLSKAGLGLRRIDSEDIPDTAKIAVVAQAVSPNRNDAALEQIVGRLSLEPYVSAASWQIDRSAEEA